MLGLALAAFFCNSAYGSGVVTRVSADWDNVQGDGGSYDSSLSDDGRYLAFSSNATNLVTGDTNNAGDIFVRDTLTGEVTRESTDSSGGQGDPFHSWHPAITGDGRYVAFSSNATTLVAGDTNSASDIFVKDRQTGATTRVSTDSSGNEANDYCYYTSISDDGRYVAFRSIASNLVAGDTNGTWDIFVKDTQTGITVRASSDASWGQGDDLSSYYPSLTVNGRYVAFSSSATNLVPGDTNGVEDIFIKDVQTGAINRISTAAGGSEGDGGSYYPHISDDGHYVAFYSAASNLVPGDNNLTEDIFVKDTQTGAVTRVSTGSAGQEGNGYSDFPNISGDGRYVTFFSAASNLVPGDTNGIDDIFFKDTQTGTTTRLSTDMAGIEGNGYSYWPKISGDGRFVSFYAAASNLVGGDTNGIDDIFLASTPACTCADPQISISASSVYWANLADYQARTLTTDFQVSRIPDINGFSITDVVNTNGVGVAEAMPVAASHTRPGQWAFTIEYMVPMGTENFRTTLFTSSMDSCGNTYLYPGATLKA
jgi:archaellum component FlaF (FlaF/FlaG flagellin family)